MKIIRFLLATSFFLFAFTTPSAQAAPNSTIPDIRLYALNCGNIDIHDFSSFSDNNYYPHKEVRLSDPCFLIKHPKGWLLWDLGIGDRYYQKRVEIKNYNLAFSATNSLAKQLKQLKITPSDIKYIAVSHAHLDHLGNVNLFPQAILLMQRAEYKYVQDKPATQDEKSSIEVIRKMRKVLLASDYDVFKDGTVRILTLPGHTPGHQALEITLSHHGVVILSGDLYHLRKSYEEQLIPSFNTNRADTLKSMAKVKNILQEKNGILMIQHDPNDFKSLPKFPEYWD